MDRLKPPYLIAESVTFWNKQFNRHPQSSDWPGLWRCESRQGLIFAQDIFLHSSHFSCVQVSATINQSMLHWPDTVEKVVEIHGLLRMILDVFGDPPSSCPFVLCHCWAKIPDYTRNTVSKSNEHNQIPQRLNSFIFRHTYRLKVKNH